MTDKEILIADYVDKIAELEKEKCELLGLIQAKDKLIEKMKCCGNCKFSPRFIIREELCISCVNSSNKNKWELAE